MARPSVTSNGGPPWAGMVQMIRVPVPWRRPQNAMRWPLGDQLGGNFQTLGFLHFHLWSDQLYACGNDNKLIIYLSDF